MNRVIITDQPGQPLLVTAYGAAGQMVAVDVSPQRALSLAEQLIEAARHRLAAPTVQAVDVLRSHFCPQGIPACDA